MTVTPPICALCKWCTLLNLCGAQGYKETKDAYNTAECKAVYAKTQEATK